MVDFNKIGQCLSYAEPLALVSLNPKGTSSDNPTENFGVVHFSVYEKAEHCKKPSLLKQLRLFNTHQYTDGATVLGIVKPNDMKRLVNLVKAIKAAPFKKKSRYHATVEVVLPNTN